MIKPDTSASSVSMLKGNPSLLSCHTTSTITRPGCMTQWPRHYGKSAGLCRTFGHLASNIEHESSLRLISPPKEPEEFFLSLIHGFPCAHGDGLGLSFALEE